MSTEMRTRKARRLTLLSSVGVHARVRGSKPPFGVSRAAWTEARRVTQIERSSPTRSKRGRWSRAEQARLRALYGLRDNDAIARELKRPIDSVVRMAKTLFPDRARVGPWTASEVLELKRYLGATTPEVIARILGRNVEEVRSQIFDLGRIRREGPWTREEVAQFKLIYGSRTDDDLARIFARNIEEVRRLARERGLSKDKAFMKKLRGEGTTRMPRWKQEDLAILRASYADGSNLEIARVLGRSVKSVVSTAHRLGLKKSPDRLHVMGQTNVRARYAPE